MALARCVIAFITAILCANPILKGAFITTLTTMIIAIDLELTQLALSFGRLNIINQILSFQIKALSAAFNSIRADLDLILGPLSRVGGCLILNNINAVLQAGLGGKQFRSFQKKLAKFQRYTNLATGIDALIKQKEKLKQDALEIIDQINIICP